MAVQDNKKVGFITPVKSPSVSSSSGNPRLIERSQGDKGSSANRLGATDASGTGASTSLKQTVTNTAAPLYQKAVDYTSQRIEDAAGLTKGLVDMAKQTPTNLMQKGIVGSVATGIEGAKQIGKDLYSASTAAGTKALDVGAKLLFGSGSSYTPSSPTTPAAPVQNYSEDTKTRLAEDAANREKAAAVNAINMAANAAKPETSADLSKIAKEQIDKGEYAESRPSTYYSPDKGYQQAAGGIKYTLDEKGVPIRTDSSGKSTRLAGISGGPGRELTDREKQAVAAGQQRVAAWEEQKAQDARNQQRQMYANMIAGAGSPSGRTVNTGLIAQAQQGLSDLDKQDVERAQLGATSAIASRKGAWEEQKDVADYNLRAREQQFKETSEGQKLALESRKAMEEPLQQLGALSAVGQLTPRMVLDTYRSKLGGAKTKEEVGSRLNELLDSNEISQDYADIIMSQY